MKHASKQNLALSKYLIVTLCIDLCVIVVWNIYVCYDFNCSLFWYTLTYNQKFTINIGFTKR